MNKNSADTASSRGEKDRLREALVEARETILDLIHARDCQYEGTDADMIGFIDAALATPTDATDGATGGGEVQRCQALVEAVRAGRFDALDAAADQWSESAGVQRMSNAIASVFEKYASQEIMDRFREKIAALMHLSFVEGAGQGVMQVADLATDAPAALATPKPPVDEAMRERIARFFCAFDNDGVASATVPQNDAFFAHWLAEDPQYYEAADALIRNLTGDGAGA